MATKTDDTTSKTYFVQFYMLISLFLGTDEGQSW